MSGQGRPRALRLSMERASTAAEFTPLTPPRVLRVDARDVEPELLERLHLQITAPLMAGTIQVPLFPQEDFPLEVPVGCQTRSWLTISQGVPGAGGATLLQSLEMLFDPPLIIHHILPVLARLHMLFEDREIAALLRRMNRLFQSPLARSGGRRLRHAMGRVLRPGLSRILPVDLPPDLRQRVKDGLRQGGEKLARVELSRVVAHPRQRRDGAWDMELRFSGSVLGLEYAAIPFHEVHVPSSILPHPHAVLSQLLTQEPLATASLRRENIRSWHLARALSGLVESFAGHLYMKGAPPDVALDLLSGDHGVLQVDLDSLGTVRLRASFKGENTPRQVELQIEEARLDQGDSHLSMQGGVVFSQPGVASDRPALACWLDALEAQEQPAVQVALDLSVQDGSSLPRLLGRVRHHHPLLRGETVMRFSLERLALAGHLRDSFLSGDILTGVQPGAREMDLGFSADLRLLDGSHVDDGRTRIVPQELGGALRGRLLADTSTLKLEVHTQAEFRLQGVTHLDPFPELDIDAGELSSQVAGQVDLALVVRARETDAGFTEIGFRDSELGVVLREFRLEQGARWLELPKGSRLRASIPAAVLATTGLGRARFEVTWDMQGRSPVLARGERQVELFVPQLRQGTVTVGLSPAGKLTVSGEDVDLYDARYFNALINPADEIQRWMEILEDDEALDHVLAAIEIFTEEGADLLSRLRQFANRVKSVLRQEDIQTVGDFLPGPTLARVASRVLVDGDDLQGRLLELVSRVTDGQGLDVRALKRLLDEVLPDHDWGYELDRGLRWLALLLKPMDPHPPLPVRELVPLVEDHRYKELFHHLPKAGDIYRTLRAEEPLDTGFTHKLARLAPYLELAQLEWILRRKRADWPEMDRLRVKHVRDLKKRIQVIGEGYGGFGFAPQARAIGFFLGAAIDLSDNETPLQEVHPLVADVLLGPADIAVLLQAGLASPLQGRTNQLNQRMLLDLILHEKPEFLQQVLLELGAGGPRVLAGVLNALLELEQGSMRKPLDLVAEFRDRLHIEFPRLEDYMAGGRWARMSYYEALNKTAEQILDTGEPYEALKAWLQVERHPLPAPLPVRATRSVRARAARAAIEEADRLGRACRFGKGRPAGGARARAAYEGAFKACRALLAEEPRAFQLPWMRAFWSRNYEALMVLSVVRNAQQDVDDVRRWLRVRTGHPLPGAEQELVEAVIQALYYWRKDQQRLARDPLVRLLMDPPPGHYDFTIVSCMGVITEGERGRELEQAYQRLEERRGVTVIRADTANMRSLDYNAARVVDAVQKATTPWGFIGYSQGCANALMAEALLKGGTPEQQALLAGFRCRNYLFSAINGSAHATFGDEKFLQAMVMGDSILAHYQATLSHQATRLALRAFRLALDSPGLIFGLRGASSLSSEGVTPLARDGQWVDHAPTCTIRGIVDGDTLPEALELLSNSLTVQIESSRHDTQVVATEALGHPVWVKNAWTEVLARCDMGSLVQATHHWSPLQHTTEFITTTRDRERAIYDYPKDRHVFPWVEVNARFGIIEPKADGV